MVLKCLPAEYAELHRQVKQGLVTGVFKQEKPVANYVGFRYDPMKSKIFEKKSGRDYILKGIELNDVKGKIADLCIYVGQDMIAGLATSQKVDFAIEGSTIKVGRLVKRFLDEFSESRLKKMFTPNQLEKINPSQVYEVELNGRTFYHIQDLDDGDFIAIDKEKNLVKITHDPYQICRVSDDFGDSF